MTTSCNRITAEQLADLVANEARDGLAWFGPKRKFVHGSGWGVLEAGAWNFENGSAVVVQTVQAVIRRMNLADVSLSYENSWFTRRVVGLLKSRLLAEVNQ